MTEDVKQIKSEAFALRIISLFSQLKEKGEFIMSKQILRSGTSIGANIAESAFAESNDDMIHKLSVAEKECSETRYWLKLLYKSNYIIEPYYESLIFDCEEIMKIIASIKIKLKAKKSFKKQ